VDSICTLHKLKGHSLFWLQAKSDVKTQAKLNVAAPGKAAPQSDSSAAKQGLCVMTCNNSSNNNKDQSN